MRAVIQRVQSSKVAVNNEVVGKINRGLLVFLGVKEDDEEEDLLYLVDKIVNLRIFEDEAGKMNRSLLDIDGEILLVSQFTLYGVAKRKKTKLYKAAKPDKAKSFMNDL